MSASTVSKVSGIPINDAIVLENANDTLIQSTLDGLASGRNHLERVVLIGEGSVTTQIDLPDNVILENNGYLNSTLSTGHTLSALNKSNVYIEGNGEINCNTSAGSANAINYEGVTGGAVGATRVKDARAHCISIKSSSGIKVDSPTLDGFGDDGISVLLSSGWQIITPEIMNGTSAVGGSAGIEVEDASSDGLIVAPNIHDITGKGIALLCDAGGSGGVHGVRVEGGSIRDVTAKGFDSFCVKTAIISISLTGDGTTVTATKAGHGLLAGMFIHITSLSQPLYDAYAYILGVSGDDITYKATGTVLATDGIIDFFNVGLSISGLDIKRCGTSGASFQDVYSALFADVTISDCDDRGFHSVTNNQHLTIDKVHAHNSGTVGFEINGAGFSTVSNSLVRNSGLAGAERGAYFINSNDITVNDLKVVDDQAVSTTKKTGFWNLSGTNIFNNIRESGVTTSARTFGGGSGADTLGNNSIFKGNVEFVDTIRLSNTVAIGTKVKSVNHKLGNNKFVPEIGCFSVDTNSSMVASGVGEVWLSNPTATTIDVNTDVNAAGTALSFTVHADLAHDK